jgi:hypothetical protein
LMPTQGDIIFRRLSQPDGWLEHRQQSDSAI